MADMTPARAERALVLEGTPQQLRNSCAFTPTRGLEASAASTPAGEGSDGATRYIFFPVSVFLMSLSCLRRRRERLLGVPLTSEEEQPVYNAMQSYIP